MKRDDGIEQQSFDQYKHEIDARDDTRARRGTVKLRPALGNLRIWEADTGRLDEHIQSLATAGLKSKAQMHKVILTGVMSIAVRYGVLAENPVRDTTRMRRRKPSRRPSTGSAWTGFGLSFGSGWQGRRFRHRQVRARTETRSKRARRR
ncbi:hypothetical protein [Nocardia otitidiscaviarum]|uniref:hypothetical protein n=1 Tax=Nocardia otitidiscaviarum TaxID=1823 RepID=UPI001895CCA1|nr:hypothetical protein [Nocardia otitidiscaviarum]MBF6177509.1 hypothetical protein [Nocardia otitidiscaviarum]